MCGLAGWFDIRADCGPPPSAERRRRALDLLAPRGPDDEGEWSAPDGRAGLLHRRLAIVDRVGGAQPATLPDGCGVLAWNGELFAADARRAELARDGSVFRTRSDSEVLAHLLASRGSGGLDDEPGQWSSAWIDVRHATLLLARDPAGEKPLYVAEQGGRVVFASTLDALLALAPIDRDVAPEALSVYLSWGFVPAPLTIFRGVRKLRAGERLTWCRDGAGRVALPAARPGVARHPATVDDLAAALGAASRRRFLHSDEPVGVFLSGGLDSLAVAAALRDEPALRTFTVRAADPRIDESADAARVARALGVAHSVIDPPDAAPDSWRTVLLRHGEPFGSASALAVDAVARTAAAHGIKVALTGDGGDEALGGYPRHTLLRRLARLPRLPRRLVPSGAAGGPGRRARRLAHLLTLSPADRCAALYEVFGEHRGALVPGDDGGAARDLIRALWGNAGAGDLAAMLRVDRALELADSHCVKIDVACMAHGVEPRCPWLDRDVVAVCDALPPALRVAGSTTKVALRELLREALPDDVARHALSRPKRGFSAGLDHALAAPEAADMLLGGALGRVPGVCADAARALLAEHRDGRGNHRFRLSVLLGLAVFAEAHL